MFQCFSSYFEHNLKELNNSYPPRLFVLVTLKHHGLRAKIIITSRHNSKICGKSFFKNFRIFIKLS